MNSVLIGHLLKVKNYLHKAYVLVGEEDSRGRGG